MGKIDIEKEDSIHVSCLFHFAYQKKQQRSLLTQRMLSLKENVDIKNLHLVMMINILQLSIEKQRSMQRFLEIKVAMCLYISNHRNLEIIYPVLLRSISNLHHLEFYKDIEFEHKIKINIGHPVPYYHHE